MISVLRMYIAQKNIKNDNDIRRNDNDINAKISITAQIKSVTFVHVFYQVLIL